MHKIDGIEVRTVALDPERSQRIRWLYEEYATGEWTIAELRDVLEERGFTSRTTDRPVLQGNAARPLWQHSPRHPRHPAYRRRPILATWALPQGRSAMWPM